MKKSIFILAALFAATFANAQITLERTFNGILYLNDNEVSNYKVYGDICAILPDFNGNIVHLIDAYSLESIATLTWSSWFLAAKGYFSNSDEVIILTMQNNHAVLLSESGSVIQDLGENPITSGGYGPLPRIKKLSDGSCKIAIVFHANGEYTTKVYSLPGNGVALEVNTPSSPKRNARKVAHEGRVLVETGSNTYTLQGQEVK